MRSSGRVNHSGLALSVFEEGKAGFEKEDVSPFLKLAPTYDDFQKDALNRQDKEEDTCTRKLEIVP